MIDIYSLDTGELLAMPTGQVPADPDAELIARDVDPVAWLLARWPRRRLGARVNRVIECLRDTPSTSADLASRIGVPVIAATRTISSLRARGRIRIVGYTADKTRIFGVGSPDDDAPRPKRERRKPEAPIIDRLRSQVGNPFAQLL